MCDSEPQQWWLRNHNSEMTIHSDHLRPCKCSWRKEDIHPREESYELYGIGRSRDEECPVQLQGRHFPKGSLPKMIMGRRAVASQKQTRVPSYSVASQGNGTNMQSLLGTELLVWGWVLLTRMQSLVTTSEGGTRHSWGWVLLTRMRSLVT